MGMSDDNNIIGKQIGQFLVVEEIGRGGMATVYRATQQSINRTVALKVLPRTFLHDPGFYERFVREVDVIAHLEHPHIVPIYDFGEQDGMPYIAMRYLSGGSLRALIKGQGASLRDLVRPVSQIAQALDHAHQNGIIHRDLKPGNVLLDDKNNAYLSDFGIARVMNSNLTGSAIIGTPAYMSPEQANGEAVDGRADIYSLGIVIFELITGREPFIAETPIAMILKHINERVPFLSDFRDDVPAALDAVIAKATEKQPENRFSSGAELAEAFENAVRNAGTAIAIPLRQEPKHDPEDPTVPPPARDAAPVATPRPTPKPSPALDGATITPQTDPALSKQVKSARHGFPWAEGIAGILVLAVIALIIWWGLGRVNTPRAAFEGGTVYTLDRYSVTVPQSWGFIRRPPQETHVWVSPDVNAKLDIAVLPLATDAAAQQSAYLASRFGAGYTLIDSAQSGAVLRQSYRRAADVEYPEGQTDVFITQEAGQLVVVALYAADSVATEALPQLEAVLQNVVVRR